MMTKLTRRHQWLLAGGLTVAAVLSAGANGAKFFPDDPVSRMVDSEDASRVQEREIDLVYDTLENSFSARAIGRQTSGRRTSTRSMRYRTRTGSRTDWASCRSRWTTW